MEQLYDATRAQILHDRFLWVNPIGTNEAHITSVETDTYIEETIKDRMNHMSVSAEIEISMFAGLISVSVNVSKLKHIFFRYLNTEKFTLIGFMFFWLCVSCPAPCAHDFFALKSTFKIQKKNHSVKEKLEKGQCL